MLPKYENDETRKREGPEMPRHALFFAYGASVSSRPLPCFIYKLIPDLQTYPI